MKEEQVARMLHLGATRVELGVQILDDGVLAGVNRGHGIEEVARATAICRRMGLKVCYHVMPGLPGSSPEKDLESFDLMFSDPRFRPDMLKLYPTMVVGGTGLHDMWKAGDYNPPDTASAVSLLSDMCSRVPPYVRIQRIQRDIPAPEISAGIRLSNLRQLVEADMVSRGVPCRCIRCREVGHTGAVLEDSSKVELNTYSYEASGGEERFISFDYEGSLVGYSRLRLDGSGTASVRELKVFGNETAIGAAADFWQHRGYGGRLLAEAEKVAAEEGYAEVRVTSGVGVREYYASKGYRLDAPYMLKSL